MKETDMKYLFLTILLIAVILSAGCVIQNNNPLVPPTSQIVYVTAFVTPTQTAHPISTSQSVYTKVINPSGSLDRVGEIVLTIATADAELQIYERHIDEKTALGIDTSAAEGKYTVARQKIDSARSRPSNQVAAALEDLDTASVAIRDGETALNKAWAEYEVALARVPVKNVDAIIAFFKGNDSTAIDYQLPSIITKRELAVSCIATANLSIAQGDFAQARQKAQDAFLLANESYTDALARQKQLTNCF
jgi:hypothetical protein